MIWVAAAGPAMMLQKGAGIPASAENAAERCERAAKQGYAPACLNTGVFETTSQPARFPSPCQVR